MNNQDTIKLLRECNFGIKMGVSSIDYILNYVKDQEYKKILHKNKQEHQELGSRTHELLNNYEETVKEPNAMAKSMSWVKSNVKLAINNSDNTVASLITDGCNMGIKSINRYLNQYKAASDDAQSIANSLIKIEEQLVVNSQKYL